MTRPTLPASPQRNAHGAPSVSPNFITEVIEADLSAGRYPAVVTRFPPEPNGYLHLGHVFACYLDYQTALDYGGRYHLRLDDTNPTGESSEYAQGIQDDLSWLGWQWGEHLYYASDHFERYYQAAVQLIRLGQAYVDSVSPAEMARLRGSATTPGRPSPYRERSVDENLDLFARMRAGEFEDGAHVLRARIDLAASNMKLRDPVLYRIMREAHYRTGNAWVIYPMYDFQHPLQDAFEGVTHSMCSLEFVDNRAIYDWLMETLGYSPRPHQYEFGRRGLEYTVVSKRKLRLLVQDGVVSGWDDPRMPTLRAVRRLGVRPEALLSFASQIGVTRTNRTVDLAVLENTIRSDLNHLAPRVMAVTDPLRVVVEGAQARRLELPYWPHDVVSDSPDGLLPLPSGERVPAAQATRPVSYGPELYIERADFEVTPPRGFKRLTPGGRVRLRGAGIVEATRYDTDEHGQVCAVYVRPLPEEAGAGGVIHWVDAATALPAEFRLYDRLFSSPHPDGDEAGAGDDESRAESSQPGEPLHEAQNSEAQTSGTQTVDRGFLRHLNPGSLRVTRGYVEASVAHDPAETRYQFERQGYFWRDPVLSTPAALVFGRIITLRDAWGSHKGSEKKADMAARAEQQGQKQAAQTSADQTAAPQAAPKQEARRPAAQKAEPAPLTPEQQAAAAALRAAGAEAADAAALAHEPLLLEYVQGLTQGVAGPDTAQLAAWVRTELAPALRAGHNRVSLAGLSDLAALLRSGEITGPMAREALGAAQDTGEAPAQIIAARGLRAMRGDELLALVRAVLAEHPAKLAEYRGGRRGLLGFFTGQAMRASAGQADPQELARVLTSELDG